MPKNNQEQGAGRPHQTLPHTPVLLAEVLSYLAPKKGQSYLDVTAGYGGHASAVLRRTGAPRKATLVDRDEQAIDALKRRYGDQGVNILHQDFLAASQQLLREDKTFDLILADLGVSSPHLEDAQRGFSFKGSGPLDMRMDRRQELTAEALVNSASQKHLEQIFRDYGQEPKARSLAHKIVASRPLKTTDQLATIAGQSAKWRRKSRIHPATRIFQALRIAVNDELQQLSKSLPLWIQLLAPEGKLVIISFHSLEDRLVKQTLSEYSASRYDAELSLLTKKPVTAGHAEIVSNPRARSSRLRAAAKIKTKIERKKENSNADSGQE